MLLLLAIACQTEPPAPPPTPAPAAPEPTPDLPGLDLVGPYYLHLSDVHLDLSGLSKDTDPKLWARTKARLTQQVQAKNPPAFLLYTGDLPGHYTCEDPNCKLTKLQVEPHRDDAKTVLQDLATIAGKIPVLYVPGNNDSLAGDYWSFADAAGTTVTSLVPGYPALNAAPSCGAPPCVVSQTSPETGYYSVRPVEGLRVIVLNSVVLGNRYQPAGNVGQIQAGDMQLAWLAQQMKNLGGDKVLVAMHIPPGDDAYAVSNGKTPSTMWARLPEGGPTWLDATLDLLAEHADSVVGIAYGHTHMEELRRTYNRGAEITEVAVSAAGITTIHGNNPGFKLVSFDPTTKELLDWVSVWTTPDEPAWGTGSYRFSEAYDCNTAILPCLQEPRYKDAAAVDAVMRTYYRLGAGDPTYDTVSGIDIVPGR